MTFVLDAPVSQNEVEAQQPDTALTIFRNLLTQKDKQTLLNSASMLLEEFRKNEDQATLFGGEIKDDLAVITRRLLDVQKDIVVPQAYETFTKVIKNIDDYQQKHSKDTNFLGFKKKPDMKKMFKDSNDLTYQMDIAENDVLKMELKLIDTQKHGEQLTKLSANMLYSMVRVIAVFEELIEINEKFLKEAQAAKNTGSKVVVLNGKQYSQQEVSILVSERTSLAAALKTTWYDWRQQFFVFKINAETSMKIVENSLNLFEACQKIRKIAIPLTRTQVITWQEEMLKKHDLHLSIDAKRKDIGFEKNASTDVSITEDKAAVDFVRNLKHQLNDFVKLEKDTHKSQLAIFDTLENGNQVSQDTEKAAYFLREIFKNV